MEYKVEFDIEKIAEEYARRAAEKIDETTLEKLEPTLNKFGWYKRGWCRPVFEVDAMSEDERIGEFVCSECGETFGDGRDQMPRYCPNCGRRCVG